MQLDGKLRTLIRQLVHDGIPLKQACQEFEIKYIQEALKLNDGNLSRAAKALGVHRNTLYNRLKGTDQPNQ
ncbi:MAG TPA: helix-turn-helix domain-containing protein [Thermoanaerobaculia bacterium]|nr:helix-turn-helix domain-containing protein [Thermoanaerobaculia bacterium]HUM28776.1 helix-turn-helix domain-containing protein [Thermoanaerobaculia bacterium]HXK67974.1 helix-turn-helix domain-containing protein [Thermoanaerobaculia bacterium]